MKLSQHELRQTAMSRMGIGSSIGMAKRHTTTTACWRDVVDSTGWLHGRRCPRPVGKLAAVLGWRTPYYYNEHNWRDGTAPAGSRQAVPTTSQQAGTTPVGPNIMTTRGKRVPRTLTRARRRGLGRPSWATSTRPQLAPSGGRTSTNGTRAEVALWWMTQGGGVEVFHLDIPIHSERDVPKFPTRPQTAARL